MRKFLFALITVIAVPGIALPESARAEDGQVAAGVAGGLLGGLLLGGALAPRPHYYGPGPEYVEPAPVYDEPRYHCYWTRGEPYFDDYRGIWRRPRMRVCD